MNQQQEIDQYCRRYKIMGMAPIIDELVRKAENEQLSYVNFLLQLFEQESAHREKQAKERLLKTAQLPSKSNLDQYEQREESGLTKQKTNTARNGLAGPDVQHHDHGSIWRWENDARGWLMC